MKDLVHDTIELEFRFDAAPERVFEALTRGIGAWWSHAFREGSKVGLDPRPGGAFGESWSGGGAVYAVVRHLDPPETLILDGPMGMDGAVAASMEYTLDPDGTGTRLRLVHDILGRIDPDTIADYRAGWEAVLGISLRDYLAGK
ncbi:MAG TPA: SRPBCC domain-containing protein [Spirochaetia bacterium]|nr:SRPBCC domain-containing protein [Spirochaetales bacterium]HRY81623.1 SRPBCC domain-containing protein [Spirochaetia bacterium]